MDQKLNNWPFYTIFFLIIESTKVRVYPSSNRGTKDWDKLEAEIKKEEKETKLEGDAALNQLFQQIYGDGSDEVKRAMMKSFVSITIIVLL